MLFKETHLHGIKSGVVSVAFRKWKKASVKKGTLLKTAVGLIQIVDISTIQEDEISDNDALQAGFEDKEQLMNSLQKTENASIFKIKVCYHSEDPRIELREQPLTDKMYSELKEKIGSLDKFSKKGDWTALILMTIKENPNLHAIGISKLTGFEKDWLKLNIRKLKNLGLTISHSVGYELSPLGKEFVEKLLKEQ